MKKGTRSYVKLALGFLIGGFFLWYSLSKLDLSGAGAILRTARPEWLVLAVACLMVDYAMRAFRWHLMLRSVGARADYGTAYRIFLASVAMNNVLPFRAGDVARAVGYRNELNATTSQVLGTMVVERILDFLSLMLVFFVAVSGITTSVIPDRYLATVRVATLGMVVLLAAMLLGAGALRRRLDPQRPGFAGRFATAMGSFLEAIERVAPLRSLAPLVALSIPAWLLESGLFVCVAQALRLKVPVGGPMLAMSTGTLATLVPSTPGYVGTFDAATAAGLKAYGAADTPATVFALASHVTLWVPLTLVGFSLLSFSSLRRAAKEPVPSAWSGE